MGDIIHPPNNNFNFGHFIDQQNSLYISVGGNCPLVYLHLFRFKTNVVLQYLLLPLEHFFLHKI